MQPQLPKTIQKELNQALPANFAQAEQHAQEIYGHLQGTNDPLDGLIVPMLKHWGIKLSGTKAELIQQIRMMHRPAITQSVQNALATPLIPQAEMGRWVTRGGQIQNLPPGQTLPPTTIQALPPVQVEFKRDPLDKLTIPQLKAELRLHQGQRLGGTKAELVRRIREMRESAVTPEVQADLALPFA